MKTKQCKAEKLKKIEPGRSRTFQTSKTTPHPQGDRFLCHMEILLLLRSVVSESVSSWMQALWPSASSALLYSNSSLGLSQFLAHRSFTRASCFSRSQRAFVPCPLQVFNPELWPPGYLTIFHPETQKPCRSPCSLEYQDWSRLPRLDLKHLVVYDL